MKRSPIRARRDRPRRMSQRDDHGPGWDTTRELIYFRSRGRCEVCGTALHGSMEGHHRLSRRYGPDCPCNALALCSGCHHGTVHRNKWGAIVQGWSLSSVAVGVVPGDWPVTIFGQPSGPERLTYLDCEGAYRFEWTSGHGPARVDDKRPSREGAHPERTTP